MDATLEKEIAMLRLKAAGLNHRCQSILAMADLLSEYAQLTTAQQKQIDLLWGKVKLLPDEARKGVNALGEPV